MISEYFHLNKDDIAADLYDLIRSERDSVECLLFDYICMLLIQVYFPEMQALVLSLVQ